MQTTSSQGETVADLRRAAEIVARASRKLNDERQQCECCGLQVQDDFVEYQVHQQLTAVVRKLQTLAKRIEEKPL